MDTSSFFFNTLDTIVALVPPQTIRLVESSPDIKPFTISSSIDGSCAGPVIKCTGFALIMRMQATVVSSPGRY